MTLHPVELEANAYKDRVILDDDFVEAPPEAPELVVRSHGMTDRGKVRRANEDQFLIARHSTAHGASFNQEADNRRTRRGHLFCVSDGVGGNRGGREASTLAVQTVQSSVLDSFRSMSEADGMDEEDVLAALENAVRNADRKLHEVGDRYPRLRGMGATLTVAYSIGSRLFMAHAGDSRCYLFRGAHLKQLTRDHSMAQELQDHGVLNSEQARHSHWRRLVTNVVGGSEPRVEVDLANYELRPEDVLLLTTDGLTDLVPKDAIATLLHLESDPKRVCELLVYDANRRGGKDNITAVVARFLPAKPRRPQ